MSRLWSIIISSISVFFMTASAFADHEVAVSSFVGCWMTEEPAPIVILGAGGKSGDYRIIHEHMLLKLERIERTALVRGDYFAFTPDRSNVTGPVSVDGAFNPVEHVLTVGEPKGGLNRVHMVSHNRIIYVHTKVTETADMSVRYMQRIDCAEAKTKSDELRAVQNN